MRSQVTCVSAVHLQLLNLLAYFLVEGFLAYEFGRAAVLKNGIGHLFLITSLCGALPLALNSAIEMRSRRAFLAQHRHHPAARAEWLWGGLSR
jgi:hypothetical protein